MLFALVMSRQGIWVELQYDTLPLKVQKLTREIEMNKERTTYISTSRLGQPKGLLHHNHEKCLFFDCAGAFFFFF
jgi:hypothetical protein